MCSVLLLKALYRHAFEHSKIFSEDDNSSSENADASTHARTHRRTTQLEDLPITHFSQMCTPTKPKYFLWQIFLVSFIFASGISSELLYDAESVQDKECTNMSLSSTGSRRAGPGRDS